MKAKYSLFLILAFFILSGCSCSDDNGSNGANTVPTSTNTDSGNTNTDPDTENTDTTNTDTDTNNTDTDTNDDDFPTLPLIPAIRISIDWDSNRGSSGTEYMEWEGKANINLQLGCYDDNGITNPDYYPLKGYGTGDQFDCDVDIYSHYYIDNLVTPAFTVSVTSGAYTYGTYAFTIASDNADFGFDIYYTSDNSFYSHDDMDELIYVLNDIIFELSTESSGEVILGETINGTEYAASVGFVKP